MCEDDSVGVVVVTTTMMIVVSGGKGSKAFTRFNASEYPDSR